MPWVSDERLGAMVATMARHERELKELRDRTTFYVSPDPERAHPVFAAAEAELKDVVALLLERIGVRIEYRAPSAARFELKEDKSHD